MSTLLMLKRLDAARTAVMSELEFEQELRTAPKAFLSGNDAFTLAFTGFGEGLVKHHST